MGTHEGGRILSTEFKLHRTMHRNASTRARGGESDRSEWTVSAPLRVWDLAGFVPRQRAALMVKGRQLLVVPHVFATARLRFANPAIRRRPETADTESVLELSRTFGPLAGESFTAPLGSWSVQCRQHADGYLILTLPDEAVDPALVQDLPKAGLLF